jgi:hypothetical protein
MAFETPRPVPLIPHQPGGREPGWPRKGGDVTDSSIGKNAPGPVEPRWLRRRRRRICPLSDAPKSRRPPPHLAACPSRRLPYWPTEFGARPRGVRSLARGSRTRRSSLFDGDLERLQLGVIRGEFERAARAERGHGLVPPAFGNEHEKSIFGQRRARQVVRGGDGSRTSSGCPTSCRSSVMKAHIAGPKPASSWMAATRTPCWGGIARTSPSARRTKEVVAAGVALVRGGAVAGAHPTTAKAMSAPTHERRDVILAEDARKSARGCGPGGHRASKTSRAAATSAGGRGRRRARTGRPRWACSSSSVPP